MSMKILTRDANGVTFADPVERDLTVRIKNTDSKKSLNGVSVDNFLTEIIINDTNQINVGNTSANDQLSVRIRVSGSLMSQDRLSALIKETVLPILPAWVDENVLVGFEPTTVPVIPAGV